MPDAVSPASSAPISKDDKFAFEQNRRLGRGVNLGNALEAPNEGDWGVTLQASFFKTIKDGGFDSVRVPIRWSAHAGTQAPYTIDPAFFNRVDWVVKNAEEQHLAVILDFHNFQELIDQPEANRARFLGIWDQIARHYTQAPNSVYFELLNEPNGALGLSEEWNRIMNEAIQTVRASNPDRTIIVGPKEWYNVSRLEDLKLPKDDRNIIVSFHYYLPFQFTHQGAEWVSNSNPWLGTTWTATSSQRSSISYDLDLAKKWSEENHRPIFLGEFGAYSKADMDSRARWTEFVARSAEQRGFSWSYWEFCSGFGVYNQASQSWVEPLFKALIPDD